MSSKSWVMMASVILLFGSSSRAAGTYSGGDGTPENPFQIASAADLNMLSGNSDDWDKSFVVTTDFEVGTFMSPIGNGSVAFTGVFDGNDHVLNNLEIASDLDYSGLFGLIGASGQVSGLELSDPNAIASSANYVGVLAGYNLGSVTDCKVSYITGGEVVGDQYVGGLLGINAGTVSGCSSSVDVTGSGYVGGLIGSDQGTTLNSSAAGLVAGANLVGGFTGEASGNIAACYSDCGVYGSNFTGGFVGKDVSANITDCSSGGYVDCSNYAGGFVGYNSRAIVSRCYTTAEMAYQGGYVGAFAGRNYYGAFVNCFWNTDTAGTITAVGGGGIGTGPLTGATTAQMQTAGTFTAAGWDFFGETANGEDDIWRLCTNGTNYPLLSWEFSPADWVCPDGVNWEDYFVFLDSWLCTDTDPTWDARIDLYEDGVIDLSDFALLSRDWEPREDNGVY